MSKTRTESVKYRNLFLVIGGVALFLCLSLFFLWRPPKTAAQVYLETVGEDFSSVQKALIEYGGGIKSLSEAMAKFLENFYGQTNLLKYDAALKKTQTDIEKSQALLVTIQEARKTKESLVSPAGFERVNALLDEYYTNAEKLVESYHKKKEFQLVLMNAYGSELATQITQSEVSFNKLLNVSPSDKEIPSGPREVSIDYQTLKDLQANYQKITSLSAESLVRMQAITDVPEREKFIHQTKIDELKLLNDYAGQSLLYLNQETIPGLQSYIALSFDFSRSMKAEDDKLFENIKSQVTSVQTVNDIQRLFQIETELKDELAKLAAENKVELEISPTPSLIPSPSVEPTLDLTPRSTIMPQATVTPQTLEPTIIQDEVIPSVSELQSPLVVTPSP